MKTWRDKIAYMPIYVYMLICNPKQVSFKDKIKTNMPVLAVFQLKVHISSMNNHMAHSSKHTDHTGQHTDHTALTLFLRLFRANTIFTLELQDRESSDLWVCLFQSWDQIHTNDSGTKFTPDGLWVFDIERFGR